MSMKPTMNERAAKDRAEIQGQINDFIVRGGKIKEIPTGVSGKPIKMVKRDNGYKSPRYEDKSLGKSLVRQFGQAHRKTI